MNKTIKKLLLIVTLGMLVQSALAVNIPGNPPPATAALHAAAPQRAKLCATDLAEYRDRAKQFSAAATPRTAGARFDTSTVVVVVVVCIAVAAVAASGMSNSVVIKP
jgi:hypothetical protein